MHIYHLGISSVSLPAPPQFPMEDSADRPAEDHPPLQQHKRTRELPLSPSPASVMNEENMVAMSPTTSNNSNHHHHQDMSFDSPAAKRQRQELPTGWSGYDVMQTTNRALSCNVSPEEHRPPVMMASNTVTMERDDQYEWWKAPPSAPQLLPASTMGLSCTTTTAASSDQQSNVMGCNACQRLFVPPTITVPTPSTQQNTLFHYFTSSKPPPPPATMDPSSSSTIVDKTACLCTFCERSTCAKCFRSCEQCQHGFCTLCSTQAYVPGNSREEQTLCLDCASMLDLPQAATDDAATTTMDESMMEG